MAQKSIFFTQGLKTMKPLYGMIMMLALIVSAPFATTVHAAIGTVDNIDYVRQRGQNVPPFINPGVKANLLLLIDNSGSMLDMAYTGDQTGTCFAGTYADSTAPTTILGVDPTTDPTKLYTGYFKQDSWYVWRQTYKAAGYPSATDRAYPTVSYWESGKTYTVGDLIIDNGFFFKADSCSGTVPLCQSTGTDKDKDTGVNWSPATNVKTWIAGTSYTAGDFVKRKGQLYFLVQPTAGTYQSTINPDLDTTHWLAVSYTWQTKAERNNIAYQVGDIVTYNGMVFRAKSSSNKDTFDWKDWERLDEGYFEEVAGVTGPCASPSYSHTGGNGTDLQVTKSSTEVTCFAAKGNFLNWASASKFDIEKKVLTGGKYYTGYEEADKADISDNGDDRLVSENRGCAGTGFVKQVVVKDGTGASSFLTLRVRGAMGDNPWIVQTDDRVDSTDSTGRIEILGVNASGFSPTNCNAAYEILSDPDRPPTGSAGATEIADCMGYASTSGQPAFINGVISCNQILAGVSTSVANLAAHCKNQVYGDVSPVSITSYDPEYLCYGVFNPYIPKVDDREGYFGACWDMGVTAANTCQLATCTGSAYYADSGVTYNCLGGMERKCAPPNTFNTANKRCNANDHGWVVSYRDTTTGAPCTQSTTTTNPDWTTTNPANCTNDAAVKFCKQMKIPEVIDPSDKLTTTTESYNIPAMLIDSGVMGQLNITRPLAVLKGYIKQLEVPSGVLQRKANDLRIGAMQFTSVGSWTECQGTPDASIQKYCPQQPSLNADGSKLIAPIKLGSAADANFGLYTNNVADAVNRVQANTWTPLGEAIYSAMRYYTQRSDMCLNKDASGKCLDYPALPTADNPVQSSCQPNHLLIITEGASTADVNAAVSTFAANNPVTYENVSVTGTTCANGLQGSTYLDYMAAFGYYHKPKPEEFTSVALYNSAYAAAQLRATQLYGSASNSAIGGDIKEGVITHLITSGSLRDEGAGECNPETLMSDAAKFGGSGTYVNGENPTAFENGLNAIFDAILERASAGSAASVISSSRSGEGAVYQAIFWPEIKRTNSNDGVDVINWVGDVHALFIDSHGKLYEDTNLDGKMNICPADGDTSGLCDRHVVVYYDTTLNKSMGCYKFALDPVTQLPTTVCATGFSAPLENISYIWSANNWLDSIPSTSLLANRPSYLSEAKQRYIFTWNDLNNNGIVDDNELIPFDNSTDWNMTVTDDRGSVPKDFGLMTDADVDQIVSWVRGQDSPGLRNRQLPVSDKSSTMKNWRLGDIINSTPMVVASPQENFNLLYNDFSYAEFSQRWNKRRHVIYFGANDGMLHAVNGGFYNNVKKMFCRTQACEIDSTTSLEKNTTGTPELGAELWAYVPYNLQPHLEFLANPKYLHKYYVDLRPRIFDAQIFKPDATHPGGWGTILVAGMRLGGAPVHAKELNGIATDTRVFTSSYFVMDITDPDRAPIETGKSPILLGEMTRTSEDVNFDGLLSVGEDITPFNNTLDGSGTDMGYSTAIPTMVIMKKGEESVGSLSNKWYLLFGSGPHAYRTSGDSLGERALKGFSDQNAKVAVLPLDHLINSSSGVLGSMRIPDAVPTATDGGRYVLSDSPRGFVSDLITVDFDISPSTKDYMADSVYFGTVEADSDVVNSAGFSSSADGTYTWKGGGKLYRLVTRDRNAGSNASYYVPGKQLPFVSGDYAQAITTPDAMSNQWLMTTLMDPRRPITGAPSVAYDGNNFWVYYGTGRFYDAADKTDATQQAYYGIKEPMVSVTVGDDNIKKFTWDTVELTGIKTAAPGAKGLLPVDQILVHESTFGSKAKLSCRDNATGLDGGTTDCLPSEIVVSNEAYFDSSSGPSLLQYIAGTDDCTSSTMYKNCADGWYKKFYEYGNRERNIGQATILGGLVTFTTYQPYKEPCLSEGLSFLYGVYYQTGTAWYENIFGAAGLDYFGNVKDRLELGRGLTTTPNLFSGNTGSSDDGVKAFIQTSTGEIKEIEQHNLPINNYKTGRERWREYQR